jgi:hypothetical protein
MRSVDLASGWPSWVPRILDRFDIEGAVNENRNVAVLPNSLAELPARIRAEHEAVQVALKRGIEHAMTTGDLLLEAKAQLKHGEWTPWLREHCVISERTAHLYMQLAKNRQTIEASGNVANLTINAAVRLLAQPKDEDEQETHSKSEIADWPSVEAAVEHIVNDALAGGSDEFTKMLGVQIRRQALAHPPEQVADEDRTELPVIGAMTEGQQAELNGFIRRLNNSFFRWSDDFEAWHQTNTIDEEGKRALLHNLYQVSNAIMNLAQEVDGR